MTSYLVKIGNNSDLSLKKLSWKLATIFAITCPKRVSSLIHLDLNHYQLSPDGITFTLVKTKTTRPDEPVSAIIASFPEDTRLCPVACFKQYLQVTSNLRTATKDKPNRPFVSYIKPHHPVSPSTIRWNRHLHLQGTFSARRFHLGSSKRFGTSRRNFKNGRLVYSIYL